MAHGGQEAVLGRLAFSSSRFFSCRVLLEALALGDVAGGREDALQLALAVVEDRGVVGHDGLGPSLAAGGELVVGHLALAQHQPDAVLGAVRVGEVAS